MPPCSVEREAIGAVATWRVSGRFDGSAAWELARKLLSEPLAELIIDFSRASDFVDYGVAVLSNAILALEHKRVRLDGLRMHQARLFRYFGVDPDQPARSPDGELAPGSSALAARELH
jgi:hypothetical protein